MMPPGATLADVQLGLLVCDHVSEDFVNIAGDYPDMFRRLFARHPEVEMREYDLTAGQFPDSPAECDAWITTGSRNSVYDAVPWIEDFAGFVREIAGAGSPYVGVCFGHQMIAHALGGRVERAEAGWGLGVKEVAVPVPPRWLPTSSFRILNSHADQITALPEGGVVLGGNDHCPVSLMQLGDTMIGLQGHPEFGPGYVEALARHRRGKVPAAVADAALESLAQTPDTEVLADAIVSFLRSRQEAVPPRRVPS